LQKFLFLASCQPLFLGLGFTSRPALDFALLEKHAPSRSGKSALIGHVQT